MFRTIHRACAGAGALALLAGLTLATAPAASAAGSDITLGLVTFNDFHGRIAPYTDATTPSTQGFACTVERLRAAGSPDGSLLISSGDNVGASLFASSLANDKPTIDVLNALGVDVATVGNHEFDKGSADLVDRIAPAAKFPYLAANVLWKSTGKPIGPAYTILTVAGLKVAVVGAVTQETPSLVSPSLVSQVTFTDPVDAVNGVVADLAARKAADIYIASYHEGAAKASTLSEEVAAGGVFAKIVNKTDARVSVILNAHTHMKYSWDAQVPGAAAGVTRPVIQSASYGDPIGHLTLTVDATTHKVTAYTAENVAQSPCTSAELALPRVAEVVKTTAAALAEADKVGKVVIGKAAAAVTTAHTAGTWTDGVYGGTDAKRDDRASASTLGTMVANMYRDSMKDIADPPQIGVVNPGGLRAEIPAGDITYATAFSVLPFANDLVTVSMTGAQIYTMLEQQWQRAADGKVPSRAYLQLGLSDNVTYTFSEVPDTSVTLDDGTHPNKGVIHSVSIDGTLIDKAASYRVGTASFLAAGGDNFFVLGKSTGYTNAGVLDFDGWVNYIKATSPVEPDFARQGLRVDNLPETVKAGKDLKFSVSLIDLTSLGSPANTSLTVTLTPSSAKAKAPTPVKATFDVADGAAQVSLPVPADWAGPVNVTLDAAPSGTHVLAAPVQVLAGPALAVDPSEVLPGAEVTVSLTGADEGATYALALVGADGTVVDLGASLAPGADGTASVVVTIPEGTDPGSWTVRATEADASTLEADLTVLSTTPSEEPSQEPSGEPSGEPSDEPSAEPTEYLPTCGEVDENGDCLTPIAPCGDGCVPEPSPTDDGGLPVTGAPGWILPAAAASVLLLAAGSFVLIRRRATVR